MDAFLPIAASKALMPPGSGFNAYTNLTQLSLRQFDPEASRTLWPPVVGLIASSRVEVGAPERESVRPAQDRPEPFRNSSTVAPCARPRLAPS